MKILLAFCSCIVLFISTGCFSTSAGYAKNFVSDGGANFYGRSDDQRNTIVVSNNTPYYLAVFRNGKPVGVYVGEDGTPHGKWLNMVLRPGATGGIDLGYPRQAHYGYGGGYSEQISVSVVAYFEATMDKPAGMAQRSFYNQPSYYGEVRNEQWVVGQYEIQKIDLGK